MSFRPQIHCAHAQSPILKYGAGCSLMEVRHVRLPKDETCRMFVAWRRRHAENLSSPLLSLSLDADSGTTCFVCVKMQAINQVIQLYLEKRNATY